MELKSNRDLNFSSELIFRNIFSLDLSLSRNKRQNHNHRYKIIFLIKNLTLNLVLYIVQIESLQLIKSGKKTLFMHFTVNGSQ